MNEFLLYLCPTRNFKFGELATVIITQFSIDREKIPVSGRSFWNQISHSSLEIMN